MPDHFHLLITVGSVISVEKAVQFIKGGFAFRAGRELGFSAPVWQRGFSEIRVSDCEAFERIGDIYGAILCGVVWCWRQRSFRIRRRIQDSNSIERHRG
jgi:hypothetical protein